MSKATTTELPSPWPIHSPTTYSSNDEAANVIHAAKISPADRTDKQITILANYLQTLDLIVLRQATDMPKDFLKAAVNYFELEIFRKGSALYHHDEKAEKMYILVKGHVREYLMKPPEVVEEEHKKYLAIYGYEVSSPYSSISRPSSMNNPLITVGSNSPGLTGSPSKVAPNSNFAVHVQQQTNIQANNSTPPPSAGGLNSHRGSHGLKKADTTTGNRSSSQNSNPPKLNKVITASMFSISLTKSDNTEKQGRLSAIKANMNISPLQIQATTKVSTGPKIGSPEKRQSILSGFISKKVIEDSDVFGFRLPVESPDEKLFKTFEERAYKYFKGPILKVVGSRSFVARDKIAENTFLSEERVYNGCGVAVDDTWVLSLKYSAFENIYQTIISVMKDKIEAVARAFPAFPRDVIAKIAYLFEKIIMRHEQSVYKKGDVADSVYIVCRGEVEIMRKVQLNTSSSVSKLLVVDNATNFKPIKVYEGEIFGGESFTSQKIRECSAVSSIGTILYKIEKKNLQILASTFPHFYQHLSAICLKKIQHQKNSLETFCQKHNIYQNEKKFVMEREDLLQKVRSFRPFYMVPTTHNRHEILNLQAAQESLPKKTKLPSLEIEFSPRLPDHSKSLSLKKIPPLNLEKIPSKVGHRRYKSWQQENEVLKTTPRKSGARTNSITYSNTEVKYKLPDNDLYFESPRDSFKIDPENKIISTLKSLENERPLIDMVDDQRDLKEKLLSDLLHSYRRPAARRESPRGVTQREEQRDQILMCKNLKLLAARVKRKFATQH